MIPPGFLLQLWELQQLNAQLENPFVFMFKEAIKIRSKVNKIIGFPGFFLVHTHNMPDREAQSFRDEISQEVLKYPDVLHCTGNHNLELYKKKVFPGNIKAEEGYKNRSAFRMPVENYIGDIEPIPFGLLTNKGYAGGFVLYNIKILQELENGWEVEVRPFPVLTNHYATLSFGWNLLFALFIRVILLQSPITFENGKELHIKRVNPLSGGIGVINNSLSKDITNQLSNLMNYNDLTEPIKKVAVTIFGRTYDKFERDE